MGKYLTKREFEYKRDLFEVLGIKEEDAVGKNFEQLLKIIEQNRKQLAFKCHTDKGDRDSEKIKTLNGSKDKLEKYIQNLKDYGKNGILATEAEAFITASSQLNLFSRRKKVFSLYNSTDTLINILRIVSYFYLIVILINKCKNSHLSLNNALLIGALICLVVIPVSYIAISFKWLLKKYESAEKDLKTEHERTLRTQFEGKELEEKLKEVFYSEDFKNKATQELQGLIRNQSIVEEINKNFLFYKPKCVTSFWALSMILMTASLITESALSNFKTVDTKLLIGVSLLILSFGLQCLATEVYERKVVNLVKEERAEGKLDDVNTNVFCPTQNQELG